MQLPAAANDDEIKSILECIGADRILVLGQAQRYVFQIWQIGIPKFVDAVRAHLIAGYRIFRKIGCQAPPGQQFFSANIRLDPDSNSEDEDVYVEIRLIGRTKVLVCDAHYHFNWQPRLPK
jgi:hypothetical protein